MKHNNILLMSLNSILNKSLISVYWSDSNNKFNYSNVDITVGYNNT